MAEDGSNLNMAVGAFTVLIAIFGALIFVVMKMAGDGDKPEVKKAGAKKPRGALDRMQRGAARAAGGEGDDDESEGEDESRTGRRNAQKSEKKEEKKAQQAHEKQARAQKEEKKTEQNSKYKQKLADREAERVKREEEESAQQAEQDAKDAAEFDQWKEMFAVDAAGEDDPDDPEGKESKVAMFIDYIKERKIVGLEELSTEFKMRTTRAIDRIKELEKLDRLSGIFDDRGKYLYITHEEMAEAAQWLQKKGRISRESLVAAFNRIISLDPAAKKAAMEIDFGDTGESAAPAESAGISWDF